MLDAKAMLGSAGRQVQLLGIDANPKATAIADVLSYSQLHGMLGQWHFLTGSLAQLRRVWKAYSIGVDIEPAPDRPHPGAVRDRHPRPARQALHHPAVLRRRQPVRPTARPGGLAPAPQPPPGQLTPHLHEDHRDPAQHTRHAAALRRRIGQPRTRPHTTPAAVLRHLEPAEQRPRRTASRARPLPDRRRLLEAAAADRRRRGERRAKRLDAPRLPARPPAAARLPGHDRPRRPPRRRIRRPRRTMARAHLTHGPNPLVPAGLNLRLAQRSRAHPARPRRTRARTKASRHTRRRPRNNWRAHRRRSRGSTTKPRACSAASKHSRRGSARCAAIRS